MIILPFDIVYSLVLRTMPMLCRQFEILKLRVVSKSMVRVKDIESSAKRFMIRPPSCFMSLSSNVIIFDKLYISKVQIQFLI